MTKDEIINELISKGIVDVVGETTYFITEKYKDLMSQSAILSTVTPEVLEKPNPLNVDHILDGENAGENWSTEILETTGRTRASAFFRAFEIPTDAPDGSYRIRGLDKESINIISKIVDDNDIHSNTMIKAVNSYYAGNERPQSFKNFVKNGTILEVYEEFVSGDFNPNANGPKQNSTWD